jgi:hypothetical protein
MSTIEKECFTLGASNEFLDFFDEYVNEYTFDVRKIQRKAKFNPDQKLFANDFWNCFNKDELKACVNKLYKHQNEIITDEGEQLSPAMLKIAAIDSLYKKSKQEVYRYWEEKGLLKGQLGCALEYHEIVPVIKIQCSNSANEDKIKIFILERNIFDYDNDEVSTSGIRYIIDSSGLPYLSFWQSLFL